MTTSRSDGGPPEDEAGTAGEASEEEVPAGPAEAEDEEEAAEAPAEGPAADLAARVAAIVGSDRWSADFGTAKVRVDRSAWADAVRKTRDEAGLRFFTFLSAIDWARDVAVGDPPADENLEERYEVICGLATTTSSDLVVLSTDVGKDEPALDSIVDVFPGAGWHEREAAEMFGIDFRGHPNLVKLYLPDAFEGYPLRKSFPLLSREVKPWPGTVDVEGMPSTENPEAGAEPGEEGDG